MKKIGLIVVMIIFAGCDGLSGSTSFTQSEVAQEVDMVAQEQVQEVVEDVVPEDLGEVETEMHPEIQLEEDEVEISEHMPSAMQEDVSKIVDDNPDLNEDNANVTTVSDNPLDQNAENCLAADEDNTYNSFLKKCFSRIEANDGESITLEIDSDDDEGEVKRKTCLNEGGIYNGFLDQCIKEE